MLSRFDSWIKTAGICDKCDLLMFSLISIKMSPGDASASLLPGNSWTSQFSLVFEQIKRNHFQIYEVHVLGKDVTLEF